MTQTQARGFRVFVFLALVIAVSAFAAKPVSDVPITVINDMTVSASAVQLQASGTHERLALTVSGPDGFSFSKHFVAGATPTLRLPDLCANVAAGSDPW